MTAYPTLLSPTALGPLRLRNRVVSTSHQTTLVHDHLPTDDLIAYHEARAAGGAAAIFLEATAIHPTGLLTPHTLGGYLPGIVAGYRRLSDAVGRHDTRLLVQLFHGGREQVTSPPRAPAVAPSAVPSARFKSEPRALTVRELHELVAGYADAARRAREGGLDGIELSFAHGYLLPQFFARASNHRTDEYNGDLEARLLLAREIIAAVRTAAGPGLAVGVRLAADERGPGLMGPEACAEIAGTLCRDGGIDFASFALGHSATYAASTFIAPPPPVAENAIADPVMAARKAVAPTPVIAATRVVDLDDAERILAAGCADAIGMTRALIADPDLVAKASTDRAGTVIECIGCNQACIGHYHAGVPIACVVNIRAGRERTLPRPRRSKAQRRRVLVAGAGPAGVAAAIEAAESGDLVTLRERGDEIGGQLRLAGQAPAHVETWERWSRSMRARLYRAGVHVELDCEVKSSVVDEDWDLLVLATGARPYLPRLPKVRGRAIVSAWDAIAAPAKLTGPIMIADWGGDWAGLDAAEVLRAAGHQVELACAAVHPGETLHQYQRNLYLGRLDAAGITCRHHTELTVEGSQILLRHVFSSRTEQLPALGTIVIAHGRAPEDALWSILEGLTGVHRAGDVLGPRSLEEATLEGTLSVHPDRVIRKPTASSRTSSRSAV